MKYKTIYTLRESYTLKNLSSQKIENFLREDERAKRTKGITLIALVITIIILLILAGITISSLTGENGLIAKVNQAKKIQTESEMKESLTLIIDDLQLEKKGKSTLDDITENYLQEKMPEYEVKVISDASISGKQIIIKEDEIQKKFVLDENLNIIEIENYLYNVTKKLDKGLDINNKAEKVAYNKPYEATIITDGEYIIKNIEVKMNGQIITTDENNVISEGTGKIYIKNVIGDIEIIVAKGKSLLNENLIEGEVQLSGEQMIKSANTISKPNTFLLSVEVKDFKPYYDGNIQNQVYAPFVGFGTPGEYMGSHNCGIYLCDNSSTSGNSGVYFLNNKGDNSYVFASKIDSSKWNKFTMIYDGQNIECYINREKIGTLNGVNWIDTNLMIGGWLDGKFITSSIYWGYENGIYRNLIFAE